MTTKSPVFTFSTFVTFSGSLGRGYPEDSELFQEDNAQRCIIYRFLKNRPNHDSWTVVSNRNIQELQEVPGALCNFLHFLSLSERPMLDYGGGSRCTHAAIDRKHTLRHSIPKSCCSREGHPRKTPLVPAELDEKV